MIHVVMGSPCSGKSTYVAEHAQDGDIIADYDKIAKTIGSKTEYQAEGHVKDCAFKARQAVIDYLLENEDAEGWVIHTNPSESQMKSYIDAGADFIQIEATFEECIERAEADGRPERTFEIIHDYFGKGNEMIKIKTATFKADNGTISGYASTWIREPDSYGDIVAPGAFAESLEEIKKSGKVIPLLWNHESGDLNAYIGTCTNFEEDEVGLKFDAAFDDTKEAQRARQLAIDGRLCKFSFAYDVIEQATVALEDGREVNELRKLNIHEVSLVMYPANPDTSVIEVKAGRRNSAKDEDKLRQIIALAQECLGEIESEEAKPEDPDEDNGEERKSELIKEAEELLTKGE